jgi:hypothetical protein
MPCINYGNAIVCISPFFRLRLADGGYVYMSWHNYCGPTFFHDKHENRMIDDWWENPLICKALDWFTGRGNKA